MNTPDYYTSILDNNADNVVYMIEEKNNISPHLAYFISKYLLELRDNNESMPGDFAELLNKHFSELL